MGGRGPRPRGQDVRKREPRRRPPRGRVQAREAVRLKYCAPSAPRNLHAASTTLYPAPLHHTMFGLTLVGSIWPHTRVRSLASLPLSFIRASTSPHSLAPLAPLVRRDTPWATQIALKRKSLPPPHSLRSQARVGGVHVGQRGQVRGGVGHGADERAGRDDVGERRHVRSQSMKSFTLYEVLQAVMMSLHRSTRVP